MNHFPPTRKPYAAARTFFVIILIFSIFAIWSVLHGDSDSSSAAVAGGLQRRAVDDIDNTLGKRDQECRLVHSSKDQCAFVRANCPDEEAGLISYLQLYYCKLPKAKPFAFVLLIVWLGLLFSTIGIAASDFFCINLSTIASILGMSESMAGVTFLAFGNGSPDVFSTFAAMKTHSGSLAVGELVGAAGFITAVVAGSMAIVRPFKVARKSFVRDVGFFTVAASFSMVFLADGHLHMWECAVMVGFYVFYVITVFVWHWYLGQRRRRKEQEYAARGHFLNPESDEIEVEPYHDDDEDRQAGGSRRPSRGVSAEDFAALERGNSPLLQALDERADDETRGHWMAEISSNMRVSRPLRGERRSTINPIRPSLVGALEFRAVLSSLEKSKNIQTIPLDARRYSDDPTYTTAQQQDRMSTASNPEMSYEYVDAHDAINDPSRASQDEDRLNGQQTRVRAVSANDASSLRLDSSMFPPKDDSRSRSMDRTTSARNNEFGYFAASPAPLSRTGTGTGTSANLLAPPPETAPGLSGSGSSTSHDADSTHLLVSSPSQQSPKMDSSMVNIPRISLPSTMTRSSTQMSTPASPFPEYHDDPNFVPRSRAPSIRLPPPSIGSESTFLHHGSDEEAYERPIDWWPYKILPSPQVLISTLFPTLYSWHDKNWWEKLLGIVSAPSVFLLAITLPVVESEKDDDDGNGMPETLVGPDPGLLGPEHAASRSRRRSSVAVILPPDSPSISPSIRINGDSPQPNGHPKPPPPPSSSSAAQLAPPTSQTQPQPQQQPPPNPPPPSSPKEWNRWLIATQIFTAPLFITLLYHFNTSPPNNPKSLLLPLLSSLLLSLCLLTLLLLTTHPTHPPQPHRYTLCFLGFLVAIAWISTIAGEVVGVLKALGVILGISDAILGLTVFAVGNSLGDLVADITVARLGFPVMALSACFGGPMLNILLGIGLSGLYMTSGGYFVGTVGGGAGEWVED
ncbi:hypothetical protein Q9189_002656 [Teloschistes chrysophthalmus]